jgi:hypothetical protein
MNNLVITKTLKQCGHIFNEEIKTEDIAMDNHQVAMFVLMTGAIDSPSTTKVKIIAENEDGDNKILLEKSIIIGANNEHKFAISASQLANKNLDKVYMQVDNANEADLAGCIFVVLSEPRFSIEDGAAVEE